MLQKCGYLPAITAETKFFRAYYGQTRCGKTAKVQSNKMLGPEIALDHLVLFTMLPSCLDQTRLPFGTGDFSLPFLAAFVRPSQGRSSKRYSRIQVQKTINMLSATLKRSSLIWILSFVVFCVAQRNCAGSIYFLFDKPAPEHLAGQGQLQIADLVSDPNHVPDVWTQRLSLRQQQELTRSGNDNDHGIPFSGEVRASFYPSVTTPLVLDPQYGNGYKSARIAVDASSHFSSSGYTAGRADFSMSFWIYSDAPFKLSLNATTQAGGSPGAAAGASVIYPVTVGGAAINPYDYAHSYAVVSPNAQNSVDFADAPYPSGLYQFTFGTMASDQTNERSLTQTTNTFGSISVLMTVNAAEPPSSPVAPPKLFLLAIGEYDGANVNGYLDAQTVFDILHTSPNFAPSSLGNPIGVLHLLPNDTGIKNRIAQILSGMTVQPQDTVIFYFSGHGGDDSNGYFLDLETEQLYDFELAALFQYAPNLRAARKIFILDSCHSGGFTHELGSLNNFGLLAASSAQGFAYSDDRDGGRGIYTRDILVPYLYGNESFLDMKNGTAKQGVIIGQNFSGLVAYLKEQPGSNGMFTFSGTAVSSSDFDSLQAIIQDLGSIAPALRIVKNGPYLEVRWPANSIEWVLETNASLVTNSWTPIVGPFPMDTGEFVYSFSPADTHQFYRLNHTSTNTLSSERPLVATLPAGVAELGGVRQWQAFGRWHSLARPYLLQ